jgi:hypothetical protein
MRLLALGSLTAVALALALPASAQLAGKEIHIGIGGPLTTGAATFGVEMRQAVEFAIAEKNAAGGILGSTLVPAAPTPRKARPRRSISATTLPILPSSATSTAASASPPRRSTRNVASSC